VGELDTAARQTCRQVIKITENTDWASKQRQGKQQCRLCCSHIKDDIMPGSGESVVISDWLRL